jgi:hypothetical protein
MITNDGTVESCAGTIRVARINTNNTFLPGNLNLAKVNPAIEVRNMVSSAVVVATINVLTNAPQKSIESSTRLTLSKRCGPNQSFGG